MLLCERNGRCSVMGVTMFFHMYFSKVLRIVIFFSKYTRTLKLENFYASTVWTPPAHPVYQKYSV